MPLLALLLALAGPAPTVPQSEALLAADAAVFAPPDLKRQLVKHRARLMQGVSDAARRPAAGSDPAAHRAAAVRAAKDIAQRIRDHERFAAVVYEIGGLVHECAAIDGVPPAAPPRALFEGFTADPFGDPERLFSVSGASRWDAALSRATRLVAWIWKKAGGDASIASRLPAAKGPYTARE